MLAHVLTAVGGLLYLVGNRIGLILINYGIFYGCGETCGEIGIEISTTLLITAILLFRLIPPFVNNVQVLIYKVVKDPKNEHSSIWSPWKITAQAMGFILELDAWFTAVSDLPLEADNNCTNQAVNLAWGVFVISLVCWAVLLIVMVIPGAVDVIKNPESPQKLHQLVIACVNILAIWFISAGLLLADNVQPLGCVFDCFRDISFTMDNSTSSSCQYDTFHGIRTAILSIIIVSISLLAVGIIVHSHRKKHENLTDSKFRQVPEVELNDIVS